MADALNFSEALALLKSGKKVARRGWNARNLEKKIDMYAEAQFPDEHSKMKQPYLFIVPGEADRVPWQPSQHDLFSSDWILVQ